MQKINMLQAKSSLSRLVKAIEDGSEREIIIARNGKPAARLVALEAPRMAQRIGIAKGRFVVPDNIDGDSDDVLHLFHDGPP